MSSQTYYDKYLKYKTKYLQLKNKYQFGGSYSTAEKYFYSQIKKNYEQIYTIFNNDNFLKSIQPTQPFVLPEITSINSKTPIEEIKRIEIFNKIFAHIKTIIDTKNIDILIKIYMGNNLGSPNSLENIGRFKDNIEKLNILIENRIKDRTKESFTSLQDLESYIDSKKTDLDEIKQKNTDKKKKSEEQKAI